MDIRSKLQITWASITTAYRLGVLELAANILVQIIGFIIPATIYTLIDVAFPNFSQRHKIQGARRQPTRPQLMHCIRISLSNHILLVAMHGMALYMAGLDYSFMNLDPVIPSLRTFAVDFVFALLAREISFYYIHRALHQPSIYVYIHKIHHKYITPVAFTAEYAHPVEHILANVLPISLPLYLKGAHALSIMAFVTVEL